MAKIARVNNCEECPYICYKAITVNDEAGGKQLYLFCGKYNKKIFNYAIQKKEICSFCKLEDWPAEETIESVQQMLIDAIITKKLKIYEDVAENVQLSFGVGIGELRELYKRLEGILMTVGLRIQSFEKQEKNVKEEIDKLRLIT